MDAGGVMAVDAYGAPNFPPSKATAMIGINPSTRLHADECMPVSPYENGVKMGSNNAYEDIPGDVPAPACVQDALLMDAMDSDGSTNGVFYPMSSPPAMKGSGNEDAASKLICGAAACLSSMSCVSESANGDEFNEGSVGSRVTLGKKSSRSPPKTKMTRVVFGKDSVHEILGGGNLADVLLWRSWAISSLIIFSAIFVWVFFHFSRFTVVSTCACVTLLLLTNVAFIIDCVPPIFSFLELKEEEVRRLASNFRVSANKYFALLHYAAVGGSFKVFLKTMICLYVVSKIGRWFDFFTLLLVILVLAFTVPKAYEIYGADMDRAADLALEQSRKYYAAADMAVKSKLPIIQKINSRKQKVQ